MYGIKIKVKVKLKHILLTVVVIAAALLWKDAESWKELTAEPKTVRVLTYNIYGYNPIHGNRVSTLLSLIKNSGADIIALQEAKPWFQKRLADTYTIAEQYHMSFSGDEFSKSGLVILSRFPITGSRYYRHPGKTHTVFLISWIQIDGLIIPVVTVHLESRLEDTRMRKRQLKKIFSSIKKEETAIILGDFNFGDESETESGQFPEDVIDIWKLLKPGDRGYTWNMELNVLAKRHAYPGETSRRLDRILFRSDLLVPVHAGLFGTSSIHAGSSIMYPSDHFGLFGIFALKRKP